MEVTANIFPQNRPLYPTLRSKLLYPLRQWLENMEVCDPQLARRICRMIPAHCPFARDVNVLGHHLFRIPPLCKINPLYDELMELRFRALSFLADVCGEDISIYCQ